MAGRASYPSDLWSLGLTALHLATGAVPWSELRDAYGHRLSDTQLMYHINQMSNAHPMPSGLPPWLLQVIQGCLNFDPVTRPNAVGILDFLNHDSQTI
eukprot:gene12900-biopygen4271